MSRSQHKEVKRKCPVCKEVKAFPARNETCKPECAKVLARMRRAKRIQQQAPAVLSAERARKVEIEALKRQIAGILDTKQRNETYEGFMERAISRPVVIPRWTRKTRGRKAGQPHRVVAKAKCSDWHFGEEIDPAQVRNLNGYGTAIADRRLENYFQSILRLSFDYMQGFEYEGIVLSFLGDFVSGDIHDELKETNAAPTMLTVVRYTPRVAAGLKLLADHFKRVWVVAVVGNHGRTTKRPVFKNRVHTNYDWLFAQMLADKLADDPRIQFAIAPSQKYVYSVYTSTYLASHGDEAKGGSGIASLLSPLMLADARARKTQSYDYWELGHWHQLMNAKRIEVNGAGKGYDELALTANYDFDWPLQDLSVIDPRYGPVCHWPIRVLDKNEPWIENCPIPVPGRFDGQAPPVSLRDIPLGGVG